MKRLTPVRIPFVGAVAVGLVVMQVVGVVVNVAIFSAAGFNYADLATPGDIITGGFKSLIALFAGIAAAAFLPALYVSFFAMKRDVNPVIGGLVVIISAAIVMLSCVVVVLSAALGNIGRKEQSIWRAVFVGGMPYIEVEMTAPSQTGTMLEEAQVQLLSRAGGFFLLNVNSKGILVRADEVRSFKRVK